MDKEVVVLMYNGISFSHEINVIRLVAAREIARYGGKVTAYIDEKIADMVIERGKKYKPKEA